MAFGFYGKLELRVINRHSACYYGGKLELPGPGFQAGAWEPANDDILFRVFRG